MQITNSQPPKTAWLNAAKVHVDLGIMSCPFNKGPSTSQVTACSHITPIPANAHTEDYHCTQTKRQNPREPEEGRNRAKSRRGKITTALLERKKKEKKTGT